MAPVVDKVARWSAIIISLSPVIGIITRHPMPFSLLSFLGLSGFIARMMIHAVTLPIEFDASFSKALPLLREGKYVSESNEKAVSSILRAAALTYVSAALADILNLFFAELLVLSFGIIERRYTKNGENLQPILRPIKAELP